MKLNKRRILVLVFCIAALCSIILLASMLTPKTGLETAVEKAVGFFEDSNEPYALLWMDVMYRRFAITQFSDALERYDQLISAEPENVALLRIFRRIADPNNVLQTEDLDSVYSEVDELVIPALYCNQEPLPDDYVEMLENAVAVGDYQLTHTLLALVFVQENGYSLSLPEGFVESVYSSNAQLIDDDQTVTDIELEAATFLYLAEQNELVSDSFVEEVILAQKDDGGWTISGNKTDQSNWHPTILALLLLLHEQNPTDSYPPTLAQTTN